MLKRIVFGLLFSVTFFICTVVAAMICFAAIGTSGASWEPWKLTMVGRFWSVVSIGMLIVGFVLGLTGVLPPRKRKG